MRVFCTDMVGAAGNDDMLKGAEGQAACTALAKALAACTSLEELRLEGAWLSQGWAYVCL